MWCKGRSQMKRFEFKSAPIDICIPHVWFFFSIPPLLRARLPEYDFIQFLSSLSSRVPYTLPVPSIFFLRLFTVTVVPLPSLLPPILSLTVALITHYHLPFSLHFTHCLALHSTYLAPIHQSIYHSCLNGGARERRKMSLFFQRKKYLRASQLFDWLNGSEDTEANIQAIGGFS